MLAINTDRSRTHSVEQLVDQKVCDYCNTVNAVYAYTCIQCQRKFEMLSAKYATIETMNLSEALRAQVNDGKVQHCRTCGRLNSPHRLTCKTCHSDLNKKIELKPYILNRLVEQKMCEHCNTVNVASAYTCITCKREFGSLSMTHPTIETMSLHTELRAQVNDGNVVVCRNCGRLNSPMRTHCKKCHSDLSA